MSWSLWEEAALWLHKSCSPHFVDGLEQRPLFLPVWLALQEGIQVAYVACKPLDIFQAAPLYLFLALPAEWQVCPPLGSAEACSASGLGRQSALPLSALQWQHAEHFIQYY